MSEDEPDIKRENLADTDESPLGDTTEHAGEQDTDAGRDLPRPRGRATTRPSRERRPAARTARTSASPGEGEGAEGVPTPDSERLANRDDV